MGLKRRVASYVPLLSRVSRSLDRLERENRELRRLLDEQHRLHVRSDAAESAEERAADGLPIPPPALRYWVTGSTDASGFLELGRRGARTIVDLLARHGIALEDLRSVLDFGCGSGRVIRHLAGYQSLELHGTDWNRTAVAWCDEHLPFAEFGTNSLTPPTRYRHDAFDLVYAFSVFTHLDEPLQEQWMAELTRILRPGGHLMLSTHGEHCFARLTQVDQERFRRGELVVLAAGKAGQNECCAYHPPSYVRTRLAAALELVAFVAGGALGNPPQDVYLLRHRR